LCFLLFPQKHLSVQFLLLLEFAAYKKIIISFCYCPKYISSIKKKKREKREGKKKNKSFKKIFIGFYRRKLNKEKLDQVNLKLAQI
jgi:hypothetical protein